METLIKIASTHDFKFAEAVCQLIEVSAQQRGTGIAKRQPAYIQQKMENGNAVIAIHGDELAGFCYIETWEHGKYVANSGLIVNPKFRNQGLARAIKTTAMNLSRIKFPAAKLFGITTSLAVMKINTALGYQPVTFSELPQEPAFWKACEKCPNHDILTRNQHRLCLCTGMLAPASNTLSDKK